MSKLDSENVCAIALGCVGAKPPDSLYNLITEGRKSSPGHYYGWCGDLVSYVLMKAGCMDGAILNRAELNGNKWQPGDNLTRLNKWARSAKVAFGGKDTDLLDRGAIYTRIRPNGDHIGIVLAVDGTKVTSVDGNSFGGEVRLNVWSLNDKPLRTWFASCHVPTMMNDDLAFSLMGGQTLDESANEEGDGSELEMELAV